MLKLLRPAIVLLVLFTILTGVVYPLLITAIAQVVFPSQANGSLIVRAGKPAGSELIGQQFDAPQYFWGRLSATGPFPYNAYYAQTLTGSSGSNFGPTNPALIQEVQARIAALRAADPTNAAPIPVDLVTSSASGLDPDISVAAAYYQITRVAKSRGWTVAQVKTLVDQITEGRQFGFLGEPRVNVLKLNMALDNYKP
jgi:potassium-transporting ATPase KdpC subunit